MRPLNMPHGKFTQTGLYVHIPYCRHKCIYCDFFSAGRSLADWNAMCSALTAELRQRACEITSPVRSLYFGGGTPSLMPGRELVNLSDDIRNLLPDAGSNIREFTIEVNPDDISPDNIRAWEAAGVNRLSVGIQSFNDNMLRFLKRSHDAGTALRGIEILRNHFDNVSIDLIFGVPGQSVGDWEADIDIAVSLDPRHISAYSLMYEEGTPLTALRNTNRLHETDEDSSLDMFRLLTGKLSAAGFDHYEISNYAKPAFHSIHNSAYWNRFPYLGLGPSAHSYDGFRIRRANPCDLRGYLSHFASPDPPAGMFYSEESLSDDELREEAVMLGLRTARGISLSDFENEFGGTESIRLMNDSRIWLADDKLTIQDNHLKLTEAGVMLSDAIMADLI